MDNDSASDATHDSLADSTYEIISQSSYLPSDTNSQADDSDSIAEGAATPDDAGSEIAQDSAEEGVESSWIYPRVPTEIQELDPITPRLGDAPAATADDNTTSVQSSAYASTIVHSPIRSTDEGFVQVAHTLPGQIGSDVRGFGRRHDNKNEHFTTRCTLTPHSLVLDRPYRIVYHGDAAYESRILDKIAEALAASSISEPDFSNSHTRHSVVRTSWYDGDMTQPAVTLLPSLGIELITDRCHVCSSPSHVLRWTYEQMATGPFGGEKLGDHSPKTELGRIEKLHEVQETNAAAERRPDLAIYFHSSTVESTSENQDRTTTARPLFESSAYTKSLGIPTLDISNTVLEWEAGPFKPYRDQAVHMCLENARESPSSGDRVICRMPVDLEHFLQLDPGQLNRNIACISEAIEEDDSSWSAPLLSSPSDLVKYVREKADAIMTGPTSLMSVLSILIMAFVVLLSSNLFFGTLNSDLRISPAVTPSNPIPSTAYSSSVPAPLVSNPIEKGLSVVPAAKDTGVNIFTASSHSSTLEWPEGLGLRLLQDEDGTTYLHIPKKISRMRQTPDFFISASSKGKDLPVNLEKRNASAWTVDFAGVDKLHSRIEVTVWTKTSPLLRQAFLIERPVSWYGKKQLETAVSAYMSSSQALSRVAAQELDVYRKHATDMIQHSSNWLQKSLRKAHRTSHGLVEHVMENQAAELEVWQKLLSDSVHASRSNTAAALEESFENLRKIWSQRSSMLEGVGNGVGAQLSGLGQDLTHELTELRKRAHDMRNTFTKRRWGQLSGLESSTILKASNRAKALREKILSGFSPDARKITKEMKSKFHHRQRDHKGSRRSDNIKGNSRQR